MEMSLQLQCDIQKYANMQWDQLKEDNKSKMRLSVWPAQDEMSAVRFSDCENVQEYSSKIQSYVNDFNLCADTDSSSTGCGTMAKSEHTIYLIQGVPKDTDRTIFTQLIYHKIDTLAEEEEEIIVKMKANKVRLQKEDDSEVAALFSKLQTKSAKQISEQTG